jgi:D-alanyl-D-alanine carboxypeptidase
MPSGSSSALVSRFAPLIVALALLGAACGGNAQVYEVPPGSLGAANLDAVKLPEPVAAVPAFLIHAPKPLTDDRLESLRRAPGVAVVAGVSIAKTSVKGPKHPARLRVAVVNPLELRSVAPAPTRDADFVWLSLLSGDAVMTPEAAKKVGVNGENDVTIRKIGDASVGALADNSAPNFADVLLSDHDGETWGRRVLAVVGAESGVTIQRLERDIKRRVPGAKLRSLLPQSSIRVPQSQTVVTGAVPTVAGMHPTLVASVSQLIEASGGRIWVVSGYRDSAHQYRLWLGALEKYGDPEIADNWVAPPGHSFHERGLAVDLGGDLDLAARLVNELGLPLWRPMSWEPWHFELIGSRG